jgi:exodeoxyribonuclease V beta subunit
MTPRYPKPAVLSRIPRAGHVVIEASAGTGKTFALEHIFVDLLLTTETRVDEILVVTFTEKATDELNTRIRRLLNNLLSWERSESDRPDDQCWILDEAARSRITSALLSLDAANISTIHAFCQRVLTENAFTHRRLLRQNRVDGRTAFSEAFADAMRSEFARDPELIPYLLASPSPPATLEKYLYECATRRGQIRPTWDPEVFRAALARVIDPSLRNTRDVDFKAAGLSRQRSAILSRLESLSTIAEGARNASDAALLRVVLDSDAQYLFEYLPAFRKSASKPLFGAIVAFCETICPMEGAIAQKFLPAVQQRIARRKQDRGEYDFDDMLELVRDSLEDEENGEALTHTLRRRFRVALIDEFQDTDEIQWGIFRRIFFESSEGHRLVVIGDPKQAIYRFRGADLATYLKARDVVRDAGGTVVPLTENFRSTAAIIRACNRMFGPTLYFEGLQYDPVTCGKPELALQEEGGREAAPVRVLTLPREVSGSFRRQLHGAIADEISGLLGDRPLLLVDGEKRTRLRASDIFCLTATDREGRELGMVLRAAGIPVAFYKQDGLFQSLEARHVRRLLEAVDDPDDREKRQRAWLTPFFGIELKDLTGLNDVPPTHPLIARLRDWHQVARRRQFDRLFGQILGESGVARREMFGADSERALTNYLHLFELLQEEAHRSHLTLPDLLRHLRSYIDRRDEMEGDAANVQRLETDKQAVQIMTMHKSKGLEAPIVFIAGGITRKWNPTVHYFHDVMGARCTWAGDILGQDVQDQNDREIREDEQRLLYVALTRAKARLYLPYFGSTETKTWVYHQIHKVLGKAILEPGFECVPVDGRPAAAPQDSVGASASPWSPPHELIHPQSDDASFRGIVRSRPGVLITSYSGLRRSVYDRTEIEKTEIGVEPEQEETSGPAPEELPGGSVTGEYLHELLELLPLEATRGAASHEAWLDRPEVSDILRTTARRYGFDEKQSAMAARLVFETLTRPVPLPDGAKLASFSHAPKLLREMEFLYPIPEEIHPRLHQVGADHERWTVGRGFIKGFIDVLFEHDGRAWFGDWKSDSLHAWDATALAREVERKYDVQVKLYCLALVKMLGIRSPEAYEARFGGYLYIFLRALTPGRSGREWLHAARPSWADILRWEDELRRWDFSDPIRPAA